MYFVVTLDLGDRSRRSSLVVSNTSVVFVAANLNHYRFLLLLESVCFPSAVRPRGLVVDSR